MIEDRDLVGIAGIVATIARGGRIAAALIVVRRRGQVEIVGDRAGRQRVDEAQLRLPGVAAVDVHADEVEIADQRGHFLAVADDRAPTTGGALHDAALDLDAVGGGVGVHRPPSRWIKRASARIASALAMTRSASASIATASS